MVKVIGSEKRISEDGKEFNVLILQGGIEIVKSKKTGKSYITAHKVSLGCTFDEATAKKLIGSELPGTIQKEACIPYDYKIPQSGEIIQLDYVFQYSQEAATMEEAVFAA